MFQIILCNWSLCVWMKCPSILRLLKDCRSFFASFSWNKRVLYNNFTEVKASGRRINIHQQLKSVAFLFNYKKKSKWLPISAEKYQSFQNIKIWQICDINIIVNHKWWKTKTSPESDWLRRIRAAIYWSS